MLTNLTAFFDPFINPHQQLPKTCLKHFPLCTNNGLSSACQALPLTVRRATALGGRVPTCPTVCRLATANPRQMNAFQSCFISFYHSTKNVFLTYSPLHKQWPVLGLSSPAPHCATRGSTGGTCPTVPNSLPSWHGQPSANECLPKLPHFIPPKTMATNNGLSSACQALLTLRGATSLVGHVPLWLTVCPLATASPLRMTMLMIKIKFENVNMKRYLGFLSFLYL